MDLDREQRRWAIDLASDVFTCLRPGHGRPYCRSFGGVRFERHGDSFPLTFPENELQGLTLEARLARPHSELDVGNDGAQPKVPIFAIESDLLPINIFSLAFLSTAYVAKIRASFKSLPDSSTILTFRIAATCRTTRIFSMSSSNRSKW